MQFHGENSKNHGKNSKFCIKKAVLLSLLIINLIPFPHFKIQRAAQKGFAKQTQRAQRAFIQVSNTWEELPGVLIRTLIVLLFLFL